MKLITLNTWGGRVTQPLFDFFSIYSKSVDVFCLQEIFHNPENNFRNTKGVPTDWRANLFLEISQVLPGFTGFFRPYVLTQYGLASFVKKSINVEQEGDVFVYKERDFTPDVDNGVTHPRNIQYMKVPCGDKSLTIINFHGLWNGKGKTDTEDRINQSKRIIAFAETIKGPKILCGDYNLLPDTESFKMLKDMGMKDLVGEYGITTTRTKLYPRASTNGLFADYILVTPDIKVNDFKVLPDVVSDHAPLFLDFELM